MVDLPVVAEENMAAVLANQCMDPGIGTTLMSTQEAAKMAHVADIVCKMIPMAWEDTTVDIEDTMIMVDLTECHHKEAEAEETPIIKTDITAAMISINSPLVPTNPPDTDLVMVVVPRAVIDSEAKEMTTIIEEREAEETHPTEVVVAEINHPEMAEMDTVEMSMVLVTTQKREKVEDMVAVEVAAAAGVVEAGEEEVLHRKGGAKNEECKCIPEITVMKTTT